MTTITESISIITEFGDDAYPNEIKITMDGSQPDCPVTFWQLGKPFFSLGAEEVAEFCEQLKKLDCSNG